MRDIEFRAWHPERSEMVYFDPEKASRDEYISCHFFELMAGIHETGQGLMQYTGLKDSKGVKIFEGDILGGGDSVPRSVFFDNGPFRLNHGDNLSCAQAMVQFTAGRLTIIGNIYEHPHLIEKTESE